ncbi:MAG: 4Fe-4S binding protein [Methanocellales archaeon]
MRLKGWKELPIGAYIDKPGTAIVNKTGGWRTYRPVTNPEKCNKCKLCWIYCPDSSRVELPTHYDVNLDYCKGCGICAHECPKKAIEMKLEE